MKLFRYIYVVILVAFIGLTGNAKTAVLPVNPPFAASPATLSGMVDASIYKKLILLREVEQLNDIMLYEYVQQYAQSLTDQAYVQQLLSGYIMGELGYDVLMAGNDVALGVYAYNANDIYDRDLFELATKKYYLISASSPSIEKEEKLAVLRGYKRGNNEFCFTCNSLPEYMGFTAVKKTLRFVHGKKKYKYSLTSYNELIDIYYKQANIGLKGIFNDDINSPAAEELVSLMREDIKDMTIQEGLAFILSFTRTAFEYKSDIENGKEIYLNPEQTLFADNSDCEDRAALAFYLVRKLYDVSIAVVQFDSHVGIAVKHNSLNGYAINYDGYTYHYMEATGPQNTLKPGEMPAKYHGKSFTILTVYHP